MTQESKNILSLENVIKLTTLVLAGSGLYFKLTSDVRDIITSQGKDKEFMEYRISKLEDCCNGEDGKRVTFNQTQAIMPHETKFESD